MAEAKRMMYLVQKFIPNACPKCDRLFGLADFDYSVFLGNMVNGQNSPRLPSGYDIIVCRECGNHTARFMIETWQKSDRGDAEALAREHCASLQEVAAELSTVDQHTIVMPEYLKGGSIVLDRATPSCRECGTLMVAEEAQWKCLNCGAKLGPGDDTRGLHF